MVNNLYKRFLPALTRKLTVDDKVIPIWNTMGVIPGHIKDEVVVIGNHRDGMT